MLGITDGPRCSGLLAEIRATAVPTGAVAVWFLGQSSIVIKSPAGTLYVDPYFSDYAERVSRLAGARPRRRYPSLIDPRAEINADLVLITHDHDDHLDLDTLSFLAAASTAARFVLPGRSASVLRAAGIRPDRMIVPSPWTPISPLPGMAITALPAAHEALEDEPGLGHRFFGYHIDAGGVSVYHSGDTLVHAELLAWLKTKPVHLGFVAINGRDFFRERQGIVGNMNYREAAELAAAADFEVAVPIHYDLFDINGEESGRFVDYMYRYHPDRSVLVLGRGGRLIYRSVPREDER